MACAPGKTCCVSCQSMGQTPTAWLDPRAVLSAYATASEALEAARAQRARMSADDVQYLHNLESAWDAMPPRALMVSATADENTKSAAVANALQLAGYLRALTARVIGRSEGGASTGPTVPVPAAPTPDPGWSLPSLPSLPKLPALPGFQLDLPLLVLLALGFLVLENRS